MPGWERYKETVRWNWHLGLTSFGGPAVQFQTFHKRFVEDLEWIDEPMYQQIFCLAQSLPGSASTKMLVCINSIRNGIGAGVLSFVLFSLPGAIGMYSLAVGISHLGSTLPDPAYAFLSGMNGGTIGVIALAGVRLASRAITDKTTRLLVALGGVLGMFYTSMWYYPLLMALAGIVTFVWDMRYPQKCWAAMYHFVRIRINPVHVRNGKFTCSEHNSTTHINRCEQWPARDEEEGSIISEDITIPPAAMSARSTATSNTQWDDAYEKPQQNKHRSLPSSFCSFSTARLSKLLPPPPSKPTPPPEPAISKHSIPSLHWSVASLILLAFLIIFITATAIKCAVPHLPRLAEVFTTLYFTGTIIFGGGPVVIPLLRAYVVDPAWVTPRNFLLGVSIISAFPGPNFNLVIYLGALAAVSANQSATLGAFISFIAMYTPGLLIVVGFMGLWRRMSHSRAFLAILRGVNAAAVGLVFTAVYKLWQLADLSSQSPGGEALGGDPWLVGITAMAYVGGAWFGIIPPVAILAGGLLGLIKYYVVGS